MKNEEPHPETRMKPEHLLFLTDVKVEQLLAAAKANDPGVSFPLFALCAYCGLRIGEAVRLQAGDIEDRDNNLFLNVRTLKSGREGRLARGQRPKLIKPIPVIQKEVAVLLKNYARTKRPDAWLFPSPKGFHLSVTWAERLFKVALAQAGLDLRYSTHSLRHSFGYRAYRETGGDLHLVQRLMRHSSWRGTMRYSHLTLDDVRKKASHIFSGGPNKSTTAG